ncbi:hypothetical protein B7755_048590 [Streptomyces sp. NBS 14/10]|uniref:hypothetical protein n=1 Tax=Streptomyces sp. NBS 14/10 TaxID=1945643 RepID=UPI00211B5EF4|nr:hypothetical protein [Streptomyces sp. NBS 14/10]KAK1185261.1 hypothetical protein B7755_048590 [Streptomyces sp. NBS 14/10]
MGASLLQTHVAWAQDTASRTKAPSEPPRAVSEKNDLASALPEDRAGTPGDGWQKSADRAWTTRSHTTPPNPPGRVAEPSSKLGKGWNTSADRAVTLAADSDGVHVLVADSAKAYEWKNATVLSEPGMPADSWIGNQCVIDHEHAAVVYAPRTFTNKPDLMQGGAFAAIVNLGSGKVIKLPFTASLAYFDPTCNPDTRTAAFTAYRDMNDPRSTKTRVVSVNTAGKTTGATVTGGEITSAVPVKDGTLAARGASWSTSTGQAR